MLEHAFLALVLTLIFIMMGADNTIACLILMVKTWVIGVPILSLVSLIFSLGRHPLQVDAEPPPRKPATLPLKPKQYNTHKIVSIKKDVKTRKLPPKIRLTNARHGVFNKR